MSIFLNSVTVTYFDSSKSITCNDCRSEQRVFSAVFPNLAVTFPLVALAKV